MGFLKTAAAVRSVQWLPQGCHIQQGSFNIQAYNEPALCPTKTSSFNPSVPL